MWAVITALVFLIVPSIIRAAREPNWGLQFDNGSFSGHTISLNDLYYVRVLSRSGAFSILSQNCSQDNPMRCRQTRQIVVRLTSIVEKDNNGFEVGLNGPTPHSFYDFDNQQFTIFTRKEVFVPNSNVSADSIQLQTTITNLATGRLK